jgi:hypothetical protein
MNEKDKTIELTEALKNLLNTNAELFKLEIAQESSKIVPAILSVIIVSLFAAFFVFYFSMSIGFYLSYLLKSDYIGFGIVAGFYFLLLLILVMSRKKTVEKPFRTYIINKMFSRK